MKSSISRLSFFALAVAVGASVFGLFWSAQVQGRGAGGSNPTYCTSTGGTSSSAGGNQTMCYNGVTTPNVPAATQASYLANQQATCGACKGSGT